MVKWDMETYPPQQLGVSGFTWHIDLFSFKTTPSNVWDPTFEKRLVQSAYGFIALFYSRLGQLGFTTFFSSFLAQVVNLNAVHEQHCLLIDSTMKYKGACKGGRHSLIAKAFVFSSS